GAPNRSTGAPNRSAGAPNRSAGAPNRSAGAKTAPRAPKPLHGRPNRSTGAKTAPRAPFSPRPLGPRLGAASPCRPQWPPRARWMRGQRPPGENRAEGAHLTPSILDVGRSDILRIDGDAETRSHGESER